jgi:peroxiredoxin
VVEEGKQAPDFELTSDEGSKVKLSDFRGSPVVLYFYPKNDSTTTNFSSTSARQADSGRDKFKPPFHRRILSRLALGSVREVGEERCN